ncbi:hypothetical protein DCAR_0830874 [Daucus carota subsp. sativus]|uniref:Uncharacterized protein n=1 Tax=Daucus carota subsp. sativus TaxID=79200 RepID=A0AAF1B9N0_DAUCS|nr:hypothetical protein DCAR_0830874 [Daucus carota subsp. sativus]
MTGFGSILNFRLQKYPKYMSYNIVNNFDSDSCSIVVDGETLKISQNDVHCVLGFPLGPKSIPFVNSEPLAKEWRRQYSGSEDSSRVVVKDVLAAVRDSTIVDINFKKNFISLMICFLVQAPSNSYIRLKLLGLCCELDRCFEYNWCEFVVNCLKKSNKVWRRNTGTKFYTGSLPFLLLTSYAMDYHSQKHVNKQLVRFPKLSVMKEVSL